MKCEFDTILNNYIGESFKKEGIKNKKLLNEIGQTIDEIKKSNLQFDQEAKIFGLIRCPRCYFYQGIELNYLGLCDNCVIILLDGLPKGDYGDPKSEEIITLINLIELSRLEQLAKFKKQD